MMITGVTAEDFALIVRHVSMYGYEHNLDIKDIHRLSTNRIRASLTVRDSYRIGARTSARSRHGKWACWHAFRDVLKMLFDTYPDASVRTAFATYRGRDGFLVTFPGTYYRNAGSLASPVYFGSLCVHANCGWVDVGSPSDSPQMDVISAQASEMGNPEVLDRIMRELDEYDRTTRQTYQGSADSAGSSLNLAYSDRRV